MKHILLATLTVVAITGCTSADVLRAPGQEDPISKYAPQNEKKTNNIGVMRYLNEGAAFVREARREDAYKKMYGMCNGKYEIIAETNSETTPTTYTNETSTGFVSQTVSSTYRYIHFKCVTG